MWRTFNLILLFKKSNGSREAGSGRVNGQEGRMYGVDSGHKGQGESVYNKL